MELVLTEAISRDDHRALFESSADPFRTKGSNLCWRAKEFHVLVIDQGQPLSHVGLLRDAIEVGGVQIAVVGFGDVITVPSFQRRGLAQRCMTEAQRVAREDWRLSFGLLFCFPELARLYEGLGWRPCKGTVFVGQPEGRIEMPRMTMVQAWGETEWPRGDVVIEGLPW